LDSEKSAEAIVVVGNEPMNEAEVSQDNEGPNVKQLQILNGAFAAADRSNRNKKGEQEVGYFERKKTNANH
jgi:hypothetical protein